MARSLPNDAAPPRRPPASRYDCPVLQLRSLTKTFPGPHRRTVLQDVDLQLLAGDYVAIMGESGVGKSTLLNLVAGLDRPDAGEILVDGVDLIGLDDDALTRLRGSRMGFVFQAFHILPYLDVIQNVELPLRLLEDNRGDPGERAQEMLAAVGMESRATSMPRELSGGELQRVAIARALVHRPRLVLADEPTGNLDPDSAAQVLDLLRAQVKDNGAAGILVTHSIAAARTADRINLLTPRGLVLQSVG
jgi:putative ABC transport system ATP-binding protein